MPNSNIANNPAFFISAVNQGATTPLGPQVAGTIQQLDGNGKSIPVAVTYPAATARASVAVPAHATGPSYSFVVPFACTVTFAYVIKGLSAGGAGDELAVSKLDLAGATTSLTTAAVAIATAASAFTPFATLIDGARTFAAGESIVITPAQATDVGCTVYFDLVAA